MSSIINYYEKYDEDSRISSSMARKIEFTVTTNVLNKYVKHGDRILELGAGTGIYSFYYGRKGHEVVATDLTPKHVEIMKEKLKGEETLKLSVEVADATNLSKYETESFDIVTCLGPIYHLLEDSLREKCIKEALRVLRKGGVLAIAYINKHFIPYTMLKEGQSFLTKAFVDKILDTGLIKAGEKECFWTDAYFTSPAEMEAFLGRFNTKIVDHAATDGISQLFRREIDALTEEEYEAWLYYSIKSCRDESILGMSNHVLVVVRKV